MEKDTISISEKKGQEVDQYPKSTMAVVVYSVMVLLFTAGIGFGLMYYQSDIVKQISGLNESIKSVQTQIDKIETEENLLVQAERLTKAVTSYEKYKKNELDWYSFLKNISDNTLNEVTYTGIAIDRQKQEFRLDGVAPSYRIVAEEINLLTNNELYGSVNLSSAILRPESDSASRVAFTIDIKPLPRAFAKVHESSVLDLVEENN